MTIIEIRMRLIRWCAFLVAATHTWNGLPRHITSIYFCQLLERIRRICNWINPGPPIIFCHRSTGVDQSAVSHMGCIITHHLPTRTENSFLLLEFSGPLVTNSMFPLICYIPVPYWLCKVPQQRPVWQWHLHKYILVIIIIIWNLPLFTVLPITVVLVHWL